MPLRSRRKIRKESATTTKSNESSVRNEDGIAPVAASSPRSSVDSEDECAIETAKENLRSIKKELHRKNRLSKAKIGTALTDLPFKKAIIAKAFKEMLTLNESIEQDSKNKSLETSNQQKPKRFFKEVTFDEASINLSKSKNQSDTQVKPTLNEDKCGAECSTNATFKIPALSKNRTVAYVTPGPDVNKPLSVLRRPAAGEIAVSMFGSPLLVAPDCAPTSLPQINFPTADGKVVAILPREGFTVEDMPHLSTPTRSQLKTLNKYLNDFCQQQQNT